MKLIAVRAAGARCLTQRDGRGISVGDMLELPGRRLGIVRRVDVRRRIAYAQPLRYTRAQFDKAKRAYEEFTGIEAGSVELIPQPPTPGVCFEVGELLGVHYAANFEGKRTEFFHRFKKSARPHLASSHDGQQLYILGGGFRVTDRGITDL